MPLTTRILLIGPYDPHSGEYTFLAPPLGVWRLEGTLTDAGFHAEVFDPNLCDRAPEEALDELLARSRWDVIGVSTTGMTLRYDLALAHRCHRAQPEALLVAGGMEATFQPELLFRLAPFSLVVLGEGEKPLLEIAERVEQGACLEGIEGTARLTETHEVKRHFRLVLTPEELYEATMSTPYADMPYEQYWRRLETAYRVAALPEKAAREARLSELRAVRLNTLNYCPMACTFCSSTNFLHASQGSIAKIRRLGAEQTLEMVTRIVEEIPGTRTIIFQDDIFVFRNDDRILPLCELIVAAKASGQLPSQLEFISTNRIDAMTEERLAAMPRAGFRVLGFGVENFSVDVLREFNKAQIASYIEPTLQVALELGVTPFLDLILTSPRSSLTDLATTVQSAYRWLLAGCEMGMYPYVIPFSGSRMAQDPALAKHTVHETQRIAGTDISWQQPVKILPVDEQLRDSILEIEQRFEATMELLAEYSTHLPSRLRSLVWIASAGVTLRDRGEEAPDPFVVSTAITQRLPGLAEEARSLLSSQLASIHRGTRRSQTRVAIA